MSQEPPRKVNPPRPPPPTSLEGGATPEEQFEATYREAYNLIDRGITLITEGHNAQVRGVLNQAYFPVSRFPGNNMMYFNFAKSSYSYPKMLPNKTGVRFCSLLPNYDK